MDEVEKYRVAVGGVSADDAVRTALRDYMSSMSEDYYYAGWLVDLEHTLWYFMTTPGPHQWGFGEVTEIEINRLRELHEAAGGWWTWPKDSDQQVFISTAEWQAKFLVHPFDGSKIL